MIPNLSAIPVEKIIQTGNKSPASSGAKVKNMAQKTKTTGVAITEKNVTSSVEE